MSTDEFTNAFSDKMDFAQHIVPDELEKIDRYAKGYPWEYSMLVKHAHTLEAIV